MVQALQRRAQAEHRLVLVHGLARPVLVVLLVLGVLWARGERWQGVVLVLVLVLAVEEEEEVVTQE